MINGSTIAESKRVIPRTARLFSKGRKSASSPPAMTITILVLDGILINAHGFAIPARSAAAITISPQRLGLSVKHEGNGRHSEDRQDLRLHDEVARCCIKRCGSNRRIFADVAPMVTAIGSGTYKAFALSPIACLTGGTVSVYNVEGEKDVDRLRSTGLAAPAIPVEPESGPMGIRNNKAAGVHEVIVLPDNDEPGRKHAQSVARLLFGGRTRREDRHPAEPSTEGRCVEFPGRGRQSTHCTPWSKTHRAGRRERRLVTRLRPSPELDCDIGDLDALTTQAWTIVAAHNRPELLYRHGTLAVRLEADEHGRARLVELTDARLR